MAEVLNNVPDGWEVKALGEVCEIARGGSPRPINKYLTEEEDGINWIKIGDATASDKYIYETKQRIKPEGISRSRLVKPGDFILSNSMSFGRPYIMKTTGCIHDGWLVLSDKIGCFNSDYLYHYLGSQSTFKQFDSLAAGSTVRNLNIDLVSKVVVVLPPLPEQERIVGVLDEAFEGIATATAQAEKNLQNARELFQSVLQSTFSEKGDDWVEAALGDVCSIKHGFAFKSKYFAKSGHYVVLTPGNFHEAGGYRDQKNKTKYYTDEIPKDFLLEENDFLFAMTEQAVGLLGSSIIVPESDKYLHNQRLGLVQIFNDVEWHNDFFFHQFNTHSFRTAVQSTASGVKVRHTSPKKLCEISITYPLDLESQKKTADKLNELQSETKRLETIYQRKLDALAELKQSLLQRAFTGQL